MIFKNNTFLFFLVILISLVQSNSRVAFSRPGDMMRIPNIDDFQYKNLFTINASTEILSSSQNSSALSINSNNKAGYKYGVSFVKPIEPLNSIELGLHIQKNILKYGDILIGVGAQDILIRQGEDSLNSNGLDTKGISLFTVISNKKYFEDYAIATHIGIGSGKINQDSHIYVSNPEQSLGVFLGLNFTTPFLKKNGGIDFITEFDGKGLNIGLNIPILSTTNINFGITHFENFGNYATEDKVGSEKIELQGDAPSITMGITFKVPRIIESNDDVVLTKKPYGDGVYSKTDTSILYYDPICTNVVETLRDSIKMSQNTISNLNDYNQMLQHTEVILIDSTRKNLLKEQVNQSNQNKAMRHLSRSLRYFYDEEYRVALSEVNLAIELNPNLAIAYGRRGSIYYKLGDVRRATLNWNVALQLDPEFTEIYEMLQAAEENRLTPVEISKNIGEIK